MQSIAVIHFVQNVSADFIKKQFKFLMFYPDTDIGMMMILLSNKRFIFIVESTSSRQVVKGT